MIIIQAIFDISNRNFIYKREKRMKMSLKSEHTSDMHNRKSLSVFISGQVKLTKYATVAYGLNKTWLNLIILMNILIKETWNFILLNYFDFHNWRKWRQQQQVEKLIIYLLIWLTSEGAHPLSSMLDRQIANRIMDRLV